MIDCDKLCVMRMFTAEPQCEGGREGERERREGVGERGREIPGCVQNKVFRRQAPNIQVI